jgi:thioredoxin 1
MRMNEENGAIRAIGTSQFEEYVLMRDIPVLVDFSARWCAPCRMLDAVLEQVAVAFAGRLSVVAVDVDRSAELADAFDVQSVPALMLIARGRLLGAWVGFQTAEQLTANLQDALARLEVLEDA